MVLAPSPVAAVTIESQPDGAPEIHIHPGGQGVWIARMLARLGLDVHLCAPFGGEPGPILVDLIQRHRITVHAISTVAPNGAYVHDRRDGERSEIADMAPPVLDRHGADDLCNAVLVEGLDSDIVVLGGPDHERVLSARSYHRLAANLSDGGVPVVVDLAGEFLTEAVAGGVAVAKASHEDLVEHGTAASDDPAELRRAMTSLAKAGAATVVVSRAAEPALVLAADGFFEVIAPTFERQDPRGAGDSMTAGIAAGLARTGDVTEALRLGAAAGSLNATRHGLATGDPELIERLAGRVDVRAWRED